MVAEDRYRELSRQIDIQKEKVGQAERRASELRAQLRRADSKVSAEKEKLYSLWWKHTQSYGGEKVDPPKSRKSRYR